MIIAIDGPAASGKGTIARGLAAHYGLPFLDTGLLYRETARKVLEKLDDPNLGDIAREAARKINASALDPQILGTPEIAMAASRVARFPGVREELFRLQRDFSLQEGGAVLDGRDIGTKICPEADVKIFITAEPEIRAKRRAGQLQGTQDAALEKQILAQIRARDENDRKNPAGSFFPAKDAHLLDTSELDIEGALEAAIAIVEKHLP